MRDKIRLSPAGREEKWAKDVLALNVPTTQKDLRDTVFLLAKGNISMINLGKQGKKREQEKSTENATKLLEKLKELQDGIEHSQLRSLPESDRLFRIIGRYQEGFSSFLSGNTLAAVPSDTGLLRATLPESDARSLLSSVGIEGETLRRIRVAEDRELFEEYRDSSLLSPDTINFLAHHVPVASTQYFLDSFTREQIYEYWESITSPAIATSLGADPANMEYVDFVVEVVTNKFKNFSSTIEEEEFKELYPELDWKKPQSTLRVLFETLPGSNQEKAAFLKENVEEHKLSLDDVAYLARIPGLDKGSFSKLCTQYQDIFDPSDIMFLVRAGSDLEASKELYESLPELMKGVQVVIAIQKIFKDKGQDNEKLRELISLIDVDHSEETFSNNMLPWFFDNYEKTKEDIALLKKAGVEPLWHIYELSTDPRIPVEYSASVHTAVRDSSWSSSSMRDMIFEWYSDGITKEDIQACKGLWDETKGAPWHSANASTLRAYLEIKKDPAKIQTMKYVCEAYDKVPSEIVEWVNNGYSKEVFDAVESRHLWGKWMFVFKEFPDLGSELDALNPEDTNVLMGASATRDLVSLLQQKKTLDETVRFLKEDNKRFVEDRANKDAYSALLDRKSERHNEYVEYFSLFGVSPEYMSEKLALTAHKNELDDSLVNHIILSAYLENKLPSQQIPLIEQNNISMFTRYPIEVLRSITEGYSSVPDREKTRVAVTLFAKTDWNGALDNKSEIVKGIHKNHRMHLYEVATKKEFFRAIRQVGEHLEKKAEKIALICFDGHGNNETLQLGFPYSPKKTEIPKATVPLFSPLQRFLAPDAQLILASCSTAEGGKEADNLAVAFARTWPGVEVFAANKDTSTRGIEFSEDGRVSAVDYTGKNTMEILKL